MDFNVGIDLSKTFCENEIKAYLYFNGILSGEYDVDKNISDTDLKLKVFNDEEVKKALDEINFSIVSIEIKNLENVKNVDVCIEPKGE
jgi:hypothetical protein